MLNDWLHTIAHLLQVVLLAWDAQLSDTVSGLELTYTVCYVVTFVTGLYLHWQSWIDRNYTRSRYAAKRAWASLTQSTANHLIIITGLIMVTGLLGAGIGFIAMSLPQAGNLDEAQRTAAALSRLAFVLKAIALTAVNLTLVHWRDIASKRAHNR